MRYNKVAVALPILFALALFVEFLVRATPFMPERKTYATGVATPSKFGSRLRDLAPDALKPSKTLLAIRGTSVAARVCERAQAPQQVKLPQPLVALIHYNSWNPITPVEPILVLYDDGTVI